MSRLPQGRTSNSLGGGAAKGISVTSGGGRQKGSNSGGTSSFTSSSSSFSGGGTSNSGNFASANSARQDGKKGLNSLGNALDLGRSSSGSGSSVLGLFGNNAAGSSSVGSANNNNYNNNAFALVGGTVGTNNRAFNFDANGFGVGDGFGGFSGFGNDGLNSGSAFNSGGTLGRADINSRNFNKNFDLSTLKPVESQKVFDDYYNNFNANFQTGFDNLLKNDKEGSGTAASQSLSASRVSEGSEHDEQSSDSTGEAGPGGADANSDADSDYESDVKQGLQRETTDDPLSYITPVDSLGVYPPKSEDVLQAPPVGERSHSHAERSPGVAPPQEEEGAVAPPAAGEETPEESGASSQESAPQVL